MTRGSSGGPSADAAAGEALTAARDGSVLVLCWSREHRRNALDPVTLEALADQLAGATADPGIAACVLTGTGDVAFSAGMDLKAMSDDPGSAGRAVNRWRAVIDDPGRPVLIAAVNGMAMGGGFEIALTCDLVVAAEHATFGLPEVTHGIVPRGGALDLPAVVPVQAAMELALTGDHLPARRLHELGLVNRITPADDVVATAVAIGNQIGGYKPETVAEIRRELLATARRVAGHGS